MQMDGCWPWCAMVFRSQGSEENHQRAPLGWADRVNGTGLSGRVDSVGIALGRVVLG